MKILTTVEHLARAATLICGVILIVHGIVDSNGGVLFSGIILIALSEITR